MSVRTVLRKTIPFPLPTTDLKPCQLIRSACLKKDNAALALYSPSTGKTKLVCFGPQTKIEETLRIIFSEFGRECVEAKLFGGIFRDSNHLVIAIRDKLRAYKIKISPIVGYSESDCWSVSQSVKNGMVKVD
ncbi:MAG: hypothetical protein WCV91_00435 [Candidatus Margulisiibacteriota bacterium]